MTTKSYSVREHVRRSPIDPHAAAKAVTTQLLKEFVALEQMDREIERIVEREIARGS